MANDYAQGNEWDPMSLYLSQPASVDYGGFCQPGPPNSVFSLPLEDAVTQDAANVPTELTLSMLLPGAMQEHLTIEDWSADSTSSEGPKTFREGRSPVNRTGKPQSAEAIERRRQQNRASQLAFRARTKKLVEDLRQQITECTEHNHTMYITMQNLLEKTEMLKTSIEGALALQRSVCFETHQREKGQCTSSNFRSREAGL